MESKQVSKKLLARLPVYLQYLKSLPEDVQNISATRIAGALNLGDVLVRKDLAKVSNGGRRKVGYVRNMLIRDIEEVLDVNSCNGAVVIGTDQLGQALLDHEDFDRAGLSVLAGFGKSIKEGKTPFGKPMYDLDRLEDFCLRFPVRIGIITVPEEEAQQVCDRLVRCGIEAIWNFSTVELTVPNHILVQNENLVLSMTALWLQLKNKNRPQSMCS